MLIQIVITFFSMPHTRNSYPKTPNYDSDIDFLPLQFTFIYLAPGDLAIQSEAEINTCVEECSLLQYSYRT